MSLASIVILLQTALSLLLALQQTPNTSEAFESQVFAIVNQTVQIASEAVKENLSKTTTISTQNILPEGIEIISINVIPNTTSVKIEWQTTQPAESKVFIYKDNLSSNVFVSDKFSTMHSVNATSLTSDTNYLYDITALNEAGFSKKNGTFYTLPYSIAEISSDKDIVKNDGVDYATFTITTKLSNGQILSNKVVKINNQTYISDNNGIIIYKTTPTRAWDRCGNNNLLIVITEDGNNNYSKSISIENVQPVSPTGGMIACA